MYSRVYVTCTTITYTHPYQPHPLLLRAVTAICRRFNFIYIAAILPPRVSRFTTISFPYLQSIFKFPRSHRRCVFAKTDSASKMAVSTRRKNLLVASKTDNKIQPKVPVTHFSEKSFSLKRATIQIHERDKLLLTLRLFFFTTYLK